MAASLQFLSRAAAPVQQALAATPKRLGAMTPKTPVKAPAMSPSSLLQRGSSSPFFLGQDPMTWPEASVATSPSFRLWSCSERSAGGLPASFLLQAQASATAQEELAAAARPRAEAALRHFLSAQEDRASRSTAAASGSEESGRGAVLLGQESRAVAGGLSALLELHPPDALQEHFFEQQSAKARPVLLGRSLVAGGVAWRRQEESKTIGELDAREAAQVAHEAFLAKLQRVQGRVAALG